MIGLVSLSLGLSCSSIKVMQVDGNAMLPAYKNGDKVIVSKDLEKIDRLDVIIFRYPRDPSKRYIKRVIGLPGETISITGGKVMIDGIELAEPYVDSALSHQGYNSPALRIPSDSYYVLGDNRDNSSDSRYWGTVDKGLIEGKCSLSY
jgi:signal peptidase I